MWTQETSCRGKRVGGLAWDELLLLAVPLIVSLMGTPRAEEKESINTHLKKEGVDALGPLS